MSFVFFSKHEYACPNVGHCPHLGGAAVGTVVLAANQSGDYVQMLCGQLDAEREAIARLLEENQKLTAQIEQLKLELKVERQSKFATSASEESESEPPTEDAAGSTQPPADDPPPKKRGEDEDTQDFRSRNTLVGGTVRK